MNGKDERAKILERIKKLMALADNRGATEAEAMAAALAAQKLIAEYDVEEWELHSKDAEPMVEKRSDKASRRWRWHLAAIIGPAFRCRHFQRGSWNIKAQKWDKQMGFFGYETDARAYANQLKAEGYSPICNSWYRPHYLTGTKSAVIETYEACSCGAERNHTRSGGVETWSDDGSPCQA